MSINYAFSFQMNCVNVSLHTRDSIVDHTACVLDVPPSKNCTRSLRKRDSHQNNKHLSFKKKKQTNKHLSFSAKISVLDKLYIRLDK